MNKNKIIFGIIWVVLLLAILWLATTLNNSASGPTTKNDVGDFSIWILWDSANDFQTYLSKFKEIYPDYSSTQILVESFPDYEDYYYTLSSAFLNDKAPDMFVLNNSDSNIFENQMMWIPPDIIDPHNFRKNYEIVFGNDMITSAEIETEEWIKNVEFLKWIPVWYEVLGLYANTRYLRGKDLRTWAGINDAISSLKESNPDIIPLWIGNGNTVKYSEDIITQLFVQEWSKSLLDVKDNKEKTAFLKYMPYGDISWENAYDIKYQDMINSNKTNIDLFVNNDIAMIFGYPRIVQELDEKWFKKAFLSAWPFPQNTIQDGSTYIDYNYFVINKNTLWYNLAFDLLSYMSSDDWVEDYMEIFPYYLPAMLSEVEDRLGEDITSKYNIKYSDFYNSTSTLSSFDKGIKTIYDKEIKKILDTSSNYSFYFQSFQKNIICKTDKILNFTWLSISCE